VRRGRTSNTCRRETGNPKHQAVRAGVRPTGTLQDYVCALTRPIVTSRPLAAHTDRILAFATGDPRVPSRTRPAGDLTSLVFAADRGLAVAR